MANIRILVVDDDAVALFTLSALLQESGFNVAGVSSVREALRVMSSEVFDVLLSDLQMQGAADGLTVVSAMRQANPGAVTISLNSFPGMNAATKDFLPQADETLVKRMDITLLVDAIRQRLVIGTGPSAVIESVATILG
jgi:DNA-binding NtrC family response regulator